MCTPSANMFGKRRVKNKASITLRLLEATFATPVADVLAVEHGTQQGFVHFVLREIQVPDDYARRRSTGRCERQGSRKDVLLGFPPFFCRALDLAWAFPATRVMHHDRPLLVWMSTEDCAVRVLHMLASVALPSDTAEFDFDGLDEVVAPGKDTIENAAQPRWKAWARHGNKMLVHGKSMARAWQDHGKTMARA